MKRIYKYLIVILLGWSGLYFYYQLATYPYKVARWVQPLEAEFVYRFEKKCTPRSGWLSTALGQELYIRKSYSVQLAYIGPENVLQHCEAGYKGIFLGVPVTNSSRYRYASNTKLITVAAVLNLIALKKLHFEDRLVSFFPELKFFKDKRIRQITISNLLNHSAGFDRLSAAGDPMFLAEAKVWCPNHMEKLQRLTLAFSPGVKQNYSNLGFCLLGEVIHRVSGISYRDFVATRFNLHQRNMKFINNYYFDDEVRYDYRYEEWYDDSYLTKFDFNAISAVAGLSGSASSFAQLLWDLHNKQKSFKFPLAFDRAECLFKKPKACLKYGFFYYQPEKYGIGLFYHGGYLPGVTSLAVIDSVGGVTVFLKSGADPSANLNEADRLVWIYKRLTLLYTLQGRLPIIESFKISKFH